MSVSEPGIIPPAENRVWKQVEEDGIKTWALVAPNISASQPPSFTSLSPNLLLRIASHLSIPDINNLKQTCRTFQELINSSRLLWTIKLDELSHLTPIPYPTFTDPSSLSISSLQDVAKRASTLHRVWIEDDAPRCRSNSRVIYTPDSKDVLLMRLVRLGMKHWVICAGPGGLSCYDVDRGRRTILKNWEGCIQDVVLEAVSQVEVIIAVSLWRNEEGHERFEDGLRQHGLHALKLSVPGPGSSDSPSISELYSVETQYVPCNLAICDDLIGALAWNDDIWPNYVLLMNWKDKTSGKIELKETDCPVREPSLYIDKSRVLIFDDRSTLPVLHEYAIPTLIETDTDFPSIEARMRCSTYGLSSHPTFTSRLAVFGDRISVLSISLEDSDDDDGRRISNIYHRWLYSPTVKNEPPSGSGSSPPAIESVPSEPPPLLTSFPTFHHQGYVHHTTLHPFHHEYTIGCLAGRRGVWLEEDHDHEEKWLVGFSVPPHSPMEMGLSLGSSSGLRRVGSSQPRWKPTKNREVYDEATFAKRLNVPPSLNLGMCTAVAFDEATGVLCVGTSRGEVWVLDYA